MESVSICKRNSAHMCLDHVCSFGQGAEMEVTEWSNGEGFDVSIIKDRDERLFSLTRGEFRALALILSALDNSTC